jgi:hypothetical protein
MHFYKFCLPVLALVSAAFADAAEPPADLVINTTYLPESCPVKAQAGDQLSVHYVRY